MESLRNCVARLGPIVAEVKPVAPIKAGRCGAAAPVKLHRVGTDPGVEISPSATLNCDMVLALNDWIEKVVQPAAERILGTKVIRLRNVTAYSCRNRNSAAVGPLSEHAFANALDIAGFFTADGRLVDFRKHWGLTQRDIEAARVAADAAPTVAEKPENGAEDSRENGEGLLQAEEVPLPPLREEARAPAPTRSDTRTTSIPNPRPSPERAFLRQVHQGACGIFGTVLGPEANALHEDHLHLDMKPRRRSAFCE